MDTIGFVGLGAMGQPMAINLIKSGYQLAVYDIRSERMHDCVALGARRAHSPADAASEAVTVITMLPTGKELVEAALGSDGALASLKKGTAFIDMSTVGPQSYGAIASNAARKAWLY